MSELEVEIPEHLESRIKDPDYNRRLTQRAVAKEFVKADRPFYNVSRMHAALGAGVSSDTVQSRLDELVERGVLKTEKVNNGNVYWLNSGDSKWPIPPDVDVDPKRTEPTISEWKGYGYVRLAALSLLLAVIGTAITLFGTFQAGGYYVTPWEPSDIIAVGLSTGIVSYFGLFIAGVVWVFDVEAPLHLGELSFRNDN